MQPRTPPALMGPMTSGLGEPVPRDVSASFAAVDRQTLDARLRLVESQLAAMMSKQGNPDFTNERVNARLDALETRIRSTGSQLVDLKNGDEDLRSSYDQRADKLLTRLAEQDRTIASLSKQLARNTARLDQVDESVQSRQASSDINAEQHLSSMTAAANAQHTQRFEMVQRALQSCAQRCDRVESEMHAQIAPRVTACVQAVDALDARLRATQQAAATDTAARLEFETAFRTFLEQFQGEVAQAMSAMHKKTKTNIKSLEGVVRSEIAARMQAEERHVAELSRSGKELSAAMAALQRDVRTRFQAVTSALQRLDSQDQHVASEAAAALQRQYANSDRERDRQAAHLLQSVQHIDARTRESLQEVRQLIQRQTFELDTIHRAMSRLNIAPPPPLPPPQPFKEPQPPITLSNSNSLAEIGIGASRRRSRSASLVALSAVANGSRPASSADSDADLDSERLMRDAVKNHAEEETAAVQGRIASMLSPVSAGTYLAHASDSKFAVFPTPANAAVGAAQDSVLSHSSVMNSESVVTAVLNAALAASTHTEAARASAAFPMAAEALQQPHPSVHPLTEQVEADAVPISPVHHEPEHHKPEHHEPVHVEEPQAHVGRLEIAPRPKFVDEPDMADDYSARSMEKEPEPIAHAPVPAVEPLPAPPAAEEDSYDMPTERSTQAAAEPASAPVPEAAPVPVVEPVPAVAPISIVEPPVAKDEESYDMPTERSITEPVATAAEPVHAPVPVLEPVVVSPPAAEEESYDMPTERSEVAAPAAPQAETAPAEVPVVHVEPEPVKQPETHAEPEVPKPVETAEVKPDEKKDEQKSDQALNPPLHPAGAAFVTTANTLTSLRGISTEIPDESDRNVSSIACGPQHALLLTSLGRIYACGSNEDHQLASVGEHVSTPARLPLPDGVAAVSIATGAQHSLAVSADGLVFAWGSGMFGRLGVGGDADHVTPTMVPNVSDAVSVHASAFNSAALLRNGHAFAWGANDYGQLGAGDTEPRASLVDISLPDTSGGSHDPIVSLALGHRHALFVGASGRLFACGDNSFGQLGLPMQEGQHAHPTLRHIDAFEHRQVVAVSCGERHSMALTHDGAVYCWGAGDTHQLGALDNVDNPTPQRVASLPLDIAAISVGGTVSCAVTHAGQVYLWGFGIESPLPKLQAHMSEHSMALVSVGGPDWIAFVARPPHDTYVLSFSDVSSDAQSRTIEMPRRAPVASFRGRHIVAASMSVGNEAFGALLDEKGRALMFGDNNNAQLGSVEPVDVPVDSARPLALATASVAQIACGAEHTLVLTTNGVVAACGAGMFGRLGLEPRSESDARAARVLRALLPRELLAAVEEADAIDAAYEAVHSNSSVSAVECVLDEGDVVTRIAASAHNSACVTRSGAVFVWGSGDCGQVGSGIMEPSFLPHRVRGALDGVHIMQVVLGERHCLALAQDGRVFSWGSNEFGQLGRTVEESTDQMSSLPHEVSLLAPSHLSADDRVVELGCAASTSFARTQHGRLLAWGAHDTQQLGGSAVEGMDARTPIVVATDAAAMFIGRLNCMYRRSDGQLLGWGFHLGANPRELHGMPASESKQTLAIGGDLIVICV